MLTVGLLLLAAGGAAVFLADSDIGSAALLLAGVALLLFAVAGTVPSRFKFGDTEIIFSEVVIDEALDEIPTAEAKARFASTVALQVETPYREAVAAVFGSYYLYERAALGALRRVAYALGLQASESRVDSGFDAEVTGESSIILVAVKHRRVGTALDLETVRNFLAARTGRDSRMLIISNVGPSNAVVEAMSTMRSTIRIVAWMSEADDVALMEALRELS
jgi:hypothetical protein